MSYHFPSHAWLQALEEKLNTDQQYAKIAQNWEGDLAFLIEADESLPEPVVMYLDLWHGKCRGVHYFTGDKVEKEAAFVLTAPFQNFERVLSGDLNPMQALTTRKLKVNGNFPYMMRNIPTILDFVRCCQEIPRG
ncbi:MAG: hypothetical protein MAG431_02483 [Chloroflexi bacterium]|nr:hypothetical protein [Chloroflexota bacterium]